LKLRSQNYIFPQRMYKTGFNWLPPFVLNSVADTEYNKQFYTFVQGKAVFCVWNTKHVL